MYKLKKMTFLEKCEDKVGPNGVSNCAQIAYLCNNTIYYTLMTEQCPKTCNRCGNSG